MMPPTATAPAAGSPSPEELDPLEAERIARAPLPTPQTLRRRRFIPLQAYKFLETNLRIADIVLRERLGL
ncbi:hypothetical protein SAMN05216355_10660 [Actinomyces ruminicola]|uniref:Uncharacterized protein n=1 Tax=Actinomyces ruminicola TaxID=332524 RepID=A0A1H0C9E2_9ACTO|nr:hypothetical protein [Actinomyces ruminicola]SDN54510.1 hypothetical protein SAMN05216355_10660 [Actinomyces ruminicola]